jgi:hypothetical protein
MRGKDEWSESLCSHVDLEARAGQSHPMPAIRGLVNEAQAALYSPIGRPSIVAASTWRCARPSRVCAPSCGSSPPWLA